MLVKYLCRIPAVPGADLCHPTKASAERECAAALKAGLEATVVEVLVRPRVQHLARAL